MTFPRLIGIAGRAGAGKDTLADHLVAKYGYVVMRMADVIKQNFFEKYGFDPSQYENREWRETPNKELGWNPRTFSWFTPRQHLQWDGTDGGTRLLGADIWCDCFERRWDELNETNFETFAPLPRVVVPDIRFVNEAQRIHKLGGVIIRVQREEANTEVTHVSEAGLPGHLIDVGVQNDDTIEHFLDMSEKMLQVAVFKQLAKDEYGIYDAPLGLPSPPTTRLNELAAEIHKSNAQWWHDLKTGTRLDRNKGEMLMLMVSELAEAMEGERKGLMDDHLPHRRMAEVELADALIRLFDYAGAYGYDLDGAVAEKRAYNATRADHKPEARLAAGGKKW